MKTPRTLRAGRFSRFVPFVAVAVAAGAGCGSSEKKPDPKPTHTEVKEEKNIDVPADEEAITTIRASREFKLAAQHLKGENADVAKARAALERAAKADGEFALARYNLAVLLEQEGKVAEASRLYREAYDKDPSLDLAVENLGVLLESRGQFDAARELYEDAIAKNAEAVGPRLRLARMQYADGDFKNAARLARQALQFDAKSLDAYRLLARLYAERKKNQLARLIALRGQKLADGDAELVYALALVAINDKDVAGARILLREVIAKDENHIDARVTLAEMALKNRDWKTATPQLQALVKLEPTNPRLHNALGIALKGQGLFNDAKNAYEAALKAESTYLPAEYNLGILKLRHLDDPEGAEDHLRKVVAEGSSGTKRARKLLEEAEMLIKAKAEEARMMAEMQRMEEEAARQAEEEAKRQAEEEAKRQAEEEATEKAAAEGAASGDAQPAADGQPAADAPPAEAAPPPPEAEPEPPKKKPQKKRRRRKPKPKPKPKPKASAPEPDDDFFGD